MHRWFLASIPEPRAADLRRRPARSQTDVDDRTKIDAHERRPVRDVMRKTIENALAAA